MKNTLTGFVLGIFALMALGAGGDPATLHRRCTAEGIPVRSVRATGASYQILFKPEATAQQRARAQQLKAELIAEPAKQPAMLPKPVGVPTRAQVTDALVVLASERDRAARARAEEIRKAYYESLR